MCVCVGGWGVGWDAWTLSFVYLTPRRRHSSVRLWQPLWFDIHDTSQAREVWLPATICTARNDWMNKWMNEQKKFIQTFFFKIYFSHFFSPDFIWYFPGSFLLLFFHFSFSSLSFVCQFAIISSYCLSSFFRSLPSHYSVTLFLFPFFFFCRPCIIVFIHFMQLLNLNKYISASRWQ